ncbi:MAG: metallophosphoesterase [Campylobacterota bacterium]|nr:metallophosphoesterase [Campylobacterota bacterium]
MRFIIFATVFLSVFALLNYYISKRFIDHLHIKQKYKKYMKIFLWINFVGIIGYMFARYNPAMPNWLFFLLSLPIGIVFLIFCTALLYDISHTFIKKVPLSDKRREFFKKSLDYSSIAIVLGLSGRSIYEARTIELEKVDVKLKGLKNSYSIVQLSDIHIGGLIDKEFIQKLVTKVNLLKPDIVVITGDMVDVALPYARPALNELKKLQSTYGTYFIIGNHEYFHGLENIIAEVKNLDITVLENDSVYIGDDKDGFNLAGVYDVMGYRTGHHKPDIKKALKDIDKNSPTVLLAHQPRFIDEVTSEVDLVLSGHTHGGQIYPFRALVKLVQPYLAGLYTHNENTQIYVNKGTGFWGPPMRLGASSEITYIKIS